MTSAHTRNSMCMSAILHGHRGLKMLTLRAAHGDLAAALGLAVETQMVTRGVDEESIVTGWRPHIIPFMKAKGTGELHSEVLGGGHAYVHCTFVRRCVWSVWCSVVKGHACGSVHR